MKVITVNEKNIKWVSSRVAKFFDGRDIIYWKNYNGGMRPRISPIATKAIMCMDDGGDVIPVDKWDTTHIFKHVTCSKKRDTVIVHLGHGNGGFMVCKKMKIAFLGNRIIIGNNYSGPFGKPVWQYECYQINTNHSGK